MAAAQARPRVRGWTSETFGCFRPRPLRRYNSKTLKLLWCILELMAIWFYNSTSIGFNTLCRIKLSEIVLIFYKSLWPWDWDLLEYGVFRFRLVLGPSERPPVKFTIIFISTNQKPALREMLSRGSLWPYCKIEEPNFGSLRPLFGIVSASL